MNMFFLHPNPRSCASLNCNTHLHKILLEACQMMACAYTPEQLHLAPRTLTGKVWGRTHVNHPMSLWVRRNNGNFWWAWEHALGLEQERRNMGCKPHACMPILWWMNANPPDLPDLPLEWPEACIPADAECRKLPGFDNLTLFQQYREYYRHDKRPIAQWHPRRMPEFML